MQLTCEHLVATPISSVEQKVLVHKLDKEGTTPVRNKGSVRLPFLAVSTLSLDPASRISKLSKDAEGAIRTLGATEPGKDGLTELVGPGAGVAAAPLVIHCHL